MVEKETDLALVNVELLDAADLENVSVLAKVNQSSGAYGSNGIGIGSRLDAVSGMASDVLEVVEGRNLYKVKVPDGYSLGDLVSSKKDPDAFRALVRDSNGKLNGDVSLRVSGVSPAQVASLALSAAAMVVGQAYMTEISNSLNAINSKLDAVASMIAGEQRAKVTNAISLANAYVALYEDNLTKPREAFQAVRNEIESRYNEVGEVVDWVTEQLTDIEKRAIEAKAKEKDLGCLLGELHSCEEQFCLCLQALSALAMTRMYYDGCLDERSACIERGRLEHKSQRFLDKRQRLAGVLEHKIGSLKGAPLALPGGSGRNVLKRVTSQTPRAAAKERLLGSKVAMQVDLRKAEKSISGNFNDYIVGIERIAEASQATRSLLTDGTECWIIESED